MFLSLILALLVLTILISLGSYQRYCEIMVHPASCFNKDFEFAVACNKWKVKKKSGTTSPLGETKWNAKGMLDTTNSF